MGLWKIRGAGYGNVEDERGGAGYGNGGIILLFYSG